MSEVRPEFRYTHSHEWIKVEGDTATVGITDHAQEELGDIVYVELPEVGRVLSREEPFGTVESVKAVSELYAPVAGEVVAVNEALVGAEGAINDAPYETGWIIKVRLKDPAEVQSLLDADAYRTEAG
jgi:glycine cleavage system H protein